MAKLSQPSIMRPLLDIISTSVFTMQDELASAKLPEPWLAAPDFHPWDDTMPPIRYFSARKDLIAALGMMTALVENPKERIITDSMAYQQPASLSLVCKARIPEILADPSIDAMEGMPIAELAEKSGINVIKLDRVMRHLCAQHIFEERTSDHYVNNRRSRALFQECDASAFVHLWSGEFIKASTIIPDMYTNPKTRDAFEPSRAPYSFAIRDDPSKNIFDEDFETISAFQHLSKPENGALIASFAKAMSGWDSRNGDGGWVDFDWARFDREKGVIVDVASGAGHFSLRISPWFEKSVIKCMDLPPVCVRGEEFIRKNAGEGFQKGKITFIPLDFFKQQIGIKNGDLYILNNILHDWDDECSLKILDNVRQAMSDRSTLLVIEMLTESVVAQHHKEPRPHANGIVNGMFYDSSSKGVIRSANPQWPLLGEWGVANNCTTVQGLEVLSVLNAVNRTPAEYDILIKKAGFMLIHAHRIRRGETILELRKTGI